MSIARQTKAEKALARARALTYLHDYFKPGDNVHTLVSHCSRSGMRHSIRTFVCKTDEHGKPYIYDASYLVAKVLDYRFDRTHGGMIVTGCGMDMAFHVVYELGRAMWPNGTPEPHGTRNGEPDSDGGYALHKVAL